MVTKPYTRTCIYCFNEFNPHGTEALICSLRCRLAHCEENGAEGSMRECIYCGDIATDVDHVPPRSARPNIQALGLPYKFYTVPACSECNSAILTNKAFWTLAERTGHVAQMLRLRHRTVLAMPDWDPEEIEELGYSLKQMVQSGAIAKAYLQARIAFADQAHEQACLLEASLS